MQFNRTCCMACAWTWHTSWPQKTLPPRQLYRTFLYEKGFPTGRVKVDPAWLINSFVEFPPVIRSQRVLRPGGTPWNFWWGVCRPHLQIQSQFNNNNKFIIIIIIIIRPKNVISHTRFQTWPQKSIPVFRADLVRD